MSENKTVNAANLSQDDLIGKMAEIVCKERKSGAARRVEFGGAAAQYLAAAYADGASAESASESIYRGVLLLTGEAMEKSYLSRALGMWALVRLLADQSPKEDGSFGKAETSAMGVVADKIASYVQRFVEPVLSAIVRIPHDEEDEGAFDGDGSDCFAAAKTLVYRWKSGKHKEALVAYLPLCERGGKCKLSRDKDSTAFYMDEWTRCLKEAGVKVDKRGGSEPKPEHEAAAKAIIGRLDTLSAVEDDASPEEKKESRVKRSKAVREVAKELTERDWKSMLRSLHSAGNLSLLNYVAKTAEELSVQLRKAPQKEAAFDKAA